MEKNLEEFQKEFSEDIKAIDVTAQDLMDVGVTKNTLAGEVVLRKAFGDEFVELKHTDNFKKETETKITKIDEMDFEYNKVYNQVCNQLENSDFNRNLASLYAKIQAEEEDE